MKNIFTLFCPVAIALVTLFPASAQDRQLSDMEKAMVVKKTIPVVFDRLKDITGVDFLAFAKPGFGIKDVVNTLPYTRSAAALRAEQIPLTLQPDSMLIDLSSLDMEGIPPFVLPFLKNIKVKFTDYQTYLTATGSGIPVEVSIPCRISVDISVIRDAAVITLTLGEQTGLLPFGELTAKLAISNMLAGMVSGMGINSGDLFSYKELPAATGGIYTYKLVIGDALRAIMSGGEEMPATDMLVGLDVTKIQSNRTVGVSLLAVPKDNDTVQIPVGDATVYLKSAALSAFTPADSIILTSYSLENGAISGYEKTIPLLQQKNAQTTVLTVQDSIRTSLADAWEWSGSRIITATTGTDPLYSMQMDVIGEDLNDDGTIDDNDRMTTMFVDVVPSVGGTAENPVQTLDIEFSSFKDGVEMKVATAYVSSNAVEVGIGNEPVGLRDVNVAVQDGEIYLMNGQDGTYFVTNLMGITLASGRISNTIRRIDLPETSKGRIYIVTVQRNGVSKSMKFIK